MNQGPSDQTASEQRTIIAAVAISLVGHILLFGISHLLSKSSLKSTPPHKVIDIDLVSAELPAQKKATSKDRQTRTAAKKTAPNSAKKSVLKKSSKKTKKPSPQKTLSSNPAVKRRRRVVTPENLVQNALKQIEREEAAKNPDPKSLLSERIKKMRQEVKGSETKTAAASSDSITAKGKKSAGEASAIERYYQSVRVIVRSNWAFPARPNASKSLQAQVSFTIMASGTIKDPWMMERSGNANFDRSAISAVLKSSPLPPFPAGIKEKAMPIIMLFNEQDLQL